MNLATRLWLAILFALFLLLTAIALVRAQYEDRILVDVTLRDRRFLARALYAAIRFNPQSEDPLAEAQAMLERHDLVDPQSSVRLVSPEHYLGLSKPRLSPDDESKMRRGEVVVLLHDGEVLTYVPISADGHLIAMELTEANAPYESIEAVSLYVLVVQLSAVGIAAGLITFVLVRVFVAAPLRNLASFARKLGDGELSARTEVVSNSRDEIAILAIEMNRMAESLQTARRALEESQADRVAALEQLRHADRLRTVGQLASALAHELGTPLNVVSGYARMIETDPSTNEESQENAQIIVEQTQRMTKIVHSLLDYSRREPSRMQVAELACVVRQAAKMIEPISRKQSVVVGLESGSEHISARADRQQLLQVFTNLFVNAVHAMPHGGRIQVAVTKTQTAPPEGVLGQFANYAVIAVSDEGTGIEAKDLPRLFEPFFSRKPSDEGTGLGLSVVEGIVSEHGGWIAVESEVGRGSCFRVFLPLAQVDEPKLEAKPALNDGAAVQPSDIESTTKSS